MTTKRLLLLLAIVLAVTLIWYFNLAGQLTLANLKAQQGAVATEFADNPLLVIASFFLLYVAFTALSVPGAVIMTLAAGAIFGLVLGTVIVSFASTIGATLSFLSSRYLLRDWVQARLGARLQAINDGVEREGAFYLFSLRLVPAFPFFLINLLMGLTPMRVRTYYWVSQLGMLLGTIVYVNAGTRLAAIETLSDIASPMLIGSFLALAATPWLAKWLLRALQARREKGRDV